MRLFILLSIFLFSNVAYSQVSEAVSSKDSVIFKIRNEPKFYVNVHAGGNMALGSTFKFYPDDITSVVVESRGGNTSIKNINYKAPSKGLGDGFRFGAGFSYIINDFINVGLDVDYFRSTINKTKDSSYTHYNESNTVDYAYQEKYNIAYDASLLTFTPNITFKAISQPRFFIYNKIGAILTIRPNSIQKEKQNVSVQNGGQASPDSTSFTQKKYDWGIKNPAFGFMGGIGIQVKLEERIRAFAEIQFSHVLFQTRSRSLTNYDVNGTNMLNTLSVSERVIEFRKDISTDNTNQNANVPTQAIVQKFPVTYVGFQVGVSYHF